MLLMAVLWLCIMPQLKATDIYWTGSAGDDDWFTANNWSPAQVPDYLDDVYLENPPGPTIDIEINSGTANCNNLFFIGTGYSMEIDKNATLEIFGIIQMDLGNMITNNGLITAEDFQCYGHFDNYHSGELQIANMLTVYSGGLFENRGSGSKFSHLDAYNLDNFGTFSNEDMSVVHVTNRLNNYADFINFNKAILEVDDYLFTSGFLQANKKSEIYVISTFEIVGDAIFEDQSLLDGDQNLLVLVYGNLYVNDKSDVLNVMELENYQYVYNESNIEVNDVRNYYEGTIYNDGIFNVLYTAETNGLIENLDQFTIWDTFTIETQGEVQNSGCFEVYDNLSNSGAYSGSLLSHAFVFGAGSYTYTRNSGGAGAHGENQGWHFISSPVWGLGCSIMFDYFVNDWDETQNTYYHYSEGSTSCDPGPDHMLNVMKGYPVKQDIDYSCNAINPGTGTDIDFVGTMNDVASGSMSIQVTGTDFEAGDPNSMNNWNLVGNPYPSAIDADAINFPPEIDQAIYYYNNSSLNYEYFVGGVGQPFIPVAQGFFIHVNTPGTFTFELDNNVRTCSGSNIWYKSDINQLLTFNITDGKYRDRTYIRFMEDASQAFDGAWDAYKMLSPEPEIPQLYSTIGSTKYSINSLTKATAVNLCFRPGNQSAYTLVVEGTDDFECIYLEDKATGALINLKSQKSYTFYREENPDQNRFIIHFDTNFPGTIENGFSVFSKGNYVYVNNTENMPGTIRIYNMLGQLEGSEELQQGLNTYESNLRKGMYIVNIQSNNFKVSAKVMIR